jgi:starch-binding outer membrane protein, SusD/RagB family
MKRISIIIALVAGLCFSCSDDFLDTKPTNQIDAEEVYKTATGAQAVLDGISRKLRVAPVSGYDDWFGVKSFDIMWDLMGEDIVCTQFGWFSYDYQLDYRMAYWSRCSFPWSLYYAVINNANNILAHAGTIPFESDAQKASILGQALTYRAWAYFNLVNIYQFTYIGHESAPGVPVYTEPTTTGKGRGTVQNVYDRITADLNEAIGIMTENPSPRRHISDIDLSVAHGIYARVALQMGNWAKAETEAETARQGYALNTRNDFASGFSVYSRSVWMWGMEINNEQSTGFGSFPSHMDMTINGYAGSWSMPKYISVALYNMMAADDIRRQLCEAYDDGTAIHYINYKFNAAHSGKGFAADQVLMRPEEMLLIQAEAIARQGGRDSEAQTLLDNLHAVRQVSPVPVTVTGTALLDAILLERRFELWGEGFRGRDIKRLKIALDRTGSDHDQAQCLYMTVAPESVLWNYQIPQSEIDANPNMDESDQND